MTLIHQKEDIEMKKLLSLVLVLMLVLSAFALAESGSVTGEWYADFYGSVYTLTLNEDGTYVLNTGFEEDETGPWALDGDQLVIGSGDDSSAFAYDGESLTMALDEEVYMVFTREMPATFEPAAPVADATLDDFAGTWTAYKCGVNGMYFDQDGIVDLFVPEANRPDVEDMEPWISEGVNFTFVRKASQVFDAVLEKEAEK